MKALGMASLSGVILGIVNHYNTETSKSELTPLYQQIITAGLVPFMIMKETNDR